MLGGCEVVKLVRISRILRGRSLCYHMSRGQMIVTQCERLTVVGLRRLGGRVELRMIAGVRRGGLL